MFLQKVLATSLVTTTLAACMVEPPIVTAVKLPSSFRYQDRQTSPSWPARDWYRGFGSQALDSLIDGAAEANGDMESARARVQQADARARQAGAALLPGLEVAPNGTYYSGHSAQGGGHEFDWTAMLSASYELDFWGKNRATAQSAEFLAGSSRAERDTVELTVLAGIATTYFQALALHGRVQIAESNRDAAKQLLDVVQARFDAGVAGPIDLATQKAAYDVALVAIVELRQAESESRSALSVLIGQLPEDLEFEATPLDGIQEPALVAGMPSELLARRPDVYLAEANLRAAHANVTAARAAMFPSMSLTAGAGVANPALPAAVLTIPGIGPSLALGANLTQPIFDHGRLKAQRDEAVAKETELLATYRASIISAFTDVENALGAVGHLNEARQAQQENLFESEKAFAGAKLRYEAGSGDYLTLLEAQRILYTARDQFMQYRLARLQAMVSLSKALGGGWNTTSPVVAHTAMETRQ